jgi:hypothetical protein
MTCWLHEGVPAVGSCPRCGKALCRACALERDGVLGCSDACIERTLLAERTLDLTYRKHLAFIKANVIFLFVAGGVMLAAIVFMAPLTIAAILAAESPGAARDFDLALFLGALGVAFNACGFIYRFYVRHAENHAAQ